MMNNIEKKKYVQRMTEFFGTKNTTELLQLASLAERTIADDKENLKYCREGWRDRALGDIQAIIRVLVDRDAKHLQ